MKKISFKIIIYLVILILFLLIGLNISSNGFYFLPFESGLFIYFALLISLIVSIQILLFDNFSFLKNHKLLGIILYIFLLTFPIIITMFPSNTNYLTHKDSNIFINFYNFISLPYYYSNFNLKKAIITVSIIPFITLLIPFLFDNKNLKGNISYIIESIYKRIHRYNFLILFSIIIFQVPNLYIYPRRIKYLLLSLLVIYLIYFLIKITISLLSIKKINKDNNSNKNLFIVLTLENSFFNLGLKSELKDFNKLSNNILNNLVIENKSFNLISFTAIRLNLIDITKYKNIYYLIITNNFSTMFIDKYSKKILFNKIAEIKDNNYKFKIIFPYGFTKIAKELEKKYKFNYKNRLDVTTILKEVVEDENNIILKQKVETLLNDIQDNPANKYIRYALNQTIKSYNPIENFYSILKVSEYCLHYRALRNIINKDLSNLPNNSKENLRIPTLGIWINYQIGKNENNNKYNNPNIIKSLNHIDDILNENHKFDNKTSCYYLDVCSYLLRIRNNILVHGILTYEVSKSLVNDLFNLMEIVVREFINLNISISEDDLIQGLFSKDFQALEKGEKDFYLYSYGIEKENKDLLLEYLDYKNGNILVKSKDNKIKIDEVIK